MTQSKIDGLLVLDKPSGITSRAALDRALGWFPRGTRAGHTGTLDPLASGVLVLCLGVATRLAEYVQRLPKTYLAGIVLGASSDTDDAEGQITPTSAVTPPEAGSLAEALQSFLGSHDQVPPAFSAAKVAGRRAYDLARRGVAVDLKPRRVTIYAIEVMRYDYPHLELEVRCGKGTYIRSLARDLGAKLGCGGYIDTLCRTAVGGFDQGQALPLDADAETARPRLLPVSTAVAALRRVPLSSADAVRLQQGQAIPLPAEDWQEDEEGALFLGDRLVAVARASAGKMRPVVVLK